MESCYCSYRMPKWLWLDRTDRLESRFTFNYRNFEFFPECCPHKFRERRLNWNPLAHFEDYEPITFALLWGCDEHMVSRGRTSNWNETAGFRVNWIRIHLWRASAQL